MPFCSHCGGVVRNDVCMECRKTGTGAATLTEQSTSTFTREGPYWETGSTVTTSSAGTSVGKPTGTGAAKAAAVSRSPASSNAPSPPSAAASPAKIPKPDNVVVGADGRARNSYRNKAGQG